jgi:hypothetical protein
MRFVLGLLITAFGVFAAPIVVGNISSPRFAVATTCSGTNPTNQPSQADCDVEGSSDALLPPANLYAFAEGRLGNYGSSGTHELDITSTSGASNPNAQFPWQSNVNYAFSLAFNPATGTLVYSMNTGGTPVTIQQTNTYNPARIIDAIFIRTTTLVVGADVKISGLSFSENGGAFTSLGAAQSNAILTSGPGSVDYLYLSNVNPNLAWELRGTARWNFTAAAVGAAPNSRVAFQIKLGNDNPSSPFVPTAGVPEPAPWMLVSAGVGLLGLRRFSRSRN